MKQPTDGLKILNVADELANEALAVNEARGSLQQKRWLFLIRYANCVAPTVFMHEQGAKAHCRHFAGLVKRTNHSS